MNRNLAQVLFAVLALLTFLAVLAGVGDFDKVKMLAVGGLLLAVAVLV